MHNQRTTFLLVPLIGLIALVPFNSTRPLSHAADTSAAQSTANRGAGKTAPLRYWQQQGFDELPLGDWLGQGRAGGSTITENQQGRIVGTGSFTVNMEFLVPESGDLEGSWTLSGNSSWDMLFNTSEGQFEGSAFMTHTAEGPIVGTPVQFSLGIAQIESDITTVGGSLQSSDPIGPIQLGVTRILCNDARGEWILSWNEELDAFEYTPTFDGDWYALRQSPEFGEDRIRAIFDASDELDARVQDIYQSASMVQGVEVIPADVLWDLIEDIVELHNTARNLSPCDRALLGDERYEDWMYRVTSQLGDMARTLLDQYDLADRPMNGRDILDLVAMLQMAAALGEGALIDTSAVEAGLQADINEILTKEGVDQAEKIAAYIAAEMAGLELPDGVTPHDIYGLETE